MSTRSKHERARGTQTEIAPALLDTAASLDDVLDGARFVPGTSAPKAPNAAHVEGGRRGARAGDAWEEAVASLLAVARERHVIRHWHQIATPTKHVRVETKHHGWQWFRKDLEDAHADFEATEYDAPGRTIVIECKSTEGALLPLRALKPQQLDHLDTAPIGLLAVEWRDEGAVTRAVRRYVIPWAEVVWQKRRTSLSIAEADMAPWRLRTGNEFFERLRGR